MATITLPVSSALAHIGLPAWATALRTANTRFALLNVPTGSVGVSIGVSATNEIQTATAQTWTTGTRIQFLASNPFGAPSIAPLSVGVDYFLIRVTSTTYYVASSKANALSNTTITGLPTVNTGFYSITPSAPNTSWPIADLIAYEITHPLYTARFPIPTVLPAPTTTGNIASLTFEYASIYNTSTTALTYNAIAMIQNSGAIGTSTGTLLSAAKLVNGLTDYTVTIATGQVKNIDYSLRYAVT